MHVRRLATRELTNVVEALPSICTLQSISTTQLRNKINATSDINSLWIYDERVYSTCQRSGKTWHVYQRLVVGFVERRKECVEQRLDDVSRVSPSSEQKYTK